MATELAMVGLSDPMAGIGREGKAQNTVCERESQGRRGFGLCPTPLSYPLLHGYFCGLTRTITSG